MSKKLRKLKKKEIMLIAIVVFFLLYIASFSVVRKMVGDEEQKETTVSTNLENGGDKNLVQKEMEIKKNMEAKKTLFQRFQEAKKIYIGDNKVKNIKVDGASLDNLDRMMMNFIKIRNPEGDYSPKNSGKSSNGIEFYTDFNIFELREGSKKVYYKIPISEKDDFQNLYRKLIYTSVEFITNGDKIGSVKVYHKNDVKKIWFWKKTDLINKILYKREVGKIQPEKEFEQTKDNYTIKLDKSGVEISIQTMGKDFIKVVCGDNTAYYEVYDTLYNYLNSLFN